MSGVVTPATSAQSVSPPLAGAPLAVELRGLVKRFGRTPVLAGVDLELSSGRVVALHGPNGSGKTTLLRTLATRLRPTDGHASVFGFDVVRQAHEVRTRIAALPVFGGAYGALSAMENLALTRALRDLPVATPDQPSAPTPIETALERVGLLEVRQQLVRTFSSGMRKRLGLAKLLLSDAALWLLDEPYAALDAQGQGLVDELIAEARARGVTVLLASHDLEHSRATTDAVLEVSGGRLRRI